MYLIGEANGIAPERRDGEADAIRAAIRDELRHVVFRNTFTGIDEHACPDPQFYSEPVVCNVRGVICTTTDHERALLNGATVESVTPVTPGYRQIHGMACTVA